MNEQETLSIIDTAWLRMDRPTNLMMICGMMMFADRVELQKLKEVVRTRMLCFHRFRQRVVEQGGNAHWEIDPHFDLEWHVRRIALPHAGMGGTLEAVTSDLISTPLDPTKPMWQFHLIDNVHGGSAIVLRIHHCYGDGFALMHVVTSMTDTDPDRPRAASEDVAGPASRRSAWERIFGPVTETIGDAVRSSLAVADVGRDLLAHPSHAIDYARTGADLAYQAGFIANMAPDSPTRFKGQLGVMKHVTWAEPLPLFEVKALSEVLKCSVNDVLVSCVTGALRTYLLEQGDPVEGIEVRALVPVNLRPPGPITELGNRFGMVFLSLPIGLEDPIERVLEVHKRMGELKGSQQPLVALGILAGMGIAPEFIKERVLEALAANASVVITNVRGSEQPRYFAGERITRQMFWVPQSGGIGIGVSILSYAGQVSFGVVTDTRRVPHPDVITRRFAGEFQALLLRALMMPWPSGG
ncbi:MAG TPA: wax ester/triacylglycerol synthase family O-acyltransferase [Burkholderiaceae bacterium]|nr:wax ester/triacylglycerol synthase family O-acyltransferase [Burkholderiaceae bacterium]